MTLKELISYYKKEIEDCDQFIWNGDEIRDPERTEEEAEVEKVLFEKFLYQLQQLSESSTT